MATGLVTGLGLFLGCATAQPFTASEQDKRAFDDVVRQAEAAGVTVGSQERAARLLAEAKSDFECSQHLPRHPEQAKALLAKAQSEAQMALELAKRDQLPARPAGEHPVVVDNAVP